jgi:hypothetical protein
MLVTFRFVLFFTAYLPRMVIFPPYLYSHLPSPFRPLIILSRMFQGNSPPLISGSTSMALTVFQMRYVYIRPIVPIDSPVSMLVMLYTTIFSYLNFTVKI